MKKQWFRLLRWLGGVMIDGGVVLMLLGCDDEWIDGRRRQWRKPVDKHHFN